MIAKELGGELRLQQRRPLPLPALHRRLVQQKFVKFIKKPELFIYIAIETEKSNCN